MGSNPSKRNGGCLGRRRSSGSKKDQDEIKLPGSRLRFSKDQLQRLNLHLIRLEQLGCGDDLSKERASLAVEVVVERLVQRLICGAATIDPRFASKFLATLEGVRDRAQPGRSPRFEYLVRIDALSSPPVYPESGSQEITTCRIIEGLGGEGTPQGFAKIRVQGEGAELWAEFINSAGFLRRDKVQERFVDLLAQAAARASDPARPDQVDESRLCGSPGKIIDAGILAQLLSRIPPEQQVFYGPADCNQSRFPDPRDFRIAIVESAPEVRLRIGFLSPTLQHGINDEGTERDVEVKLVLALGCNGWPRGCDFPTRASLGHIDCVLFHRAAQTGFYLVPGPPHPAVRCDDRTVTWQVWLPAAELALLSHYSSSSLPARVFSVLETILHQLRGRTSRQALGGFGLPLTKHQEFLKVVSRYMLRTLLWHQMEESGTLAAWTTDTLSWHVVKLLDTLLVSLRTQRARSYFFSRCNIMLQSAAAATGHHQHSEDDYLSDAAVLENFLLNLHEESLSPAPIADDEDDDDAKRFRITERLERALVHKWSAVLADLAPPATTRSQRLSFSNGAPSTSATISYNSAAASQYTQRQLDYIATLLREMLRVRQLTLQHHSAPCWLEGPLQTVMRSLNHNESVEDVVYLLSAILEQAKEQALGEDLMAGTVTRRRTGGRRTGMKPRGGGRFRSNFEAAVTSLVDSMRRDPELAAADLKDDSVLVRQVLRWLYRGLDQHQRHMAPVLRPYLNRLFAASHENGWHLEEWRKREQGEDEEIRVLGAYCGLVLSEKAKPTPALMDAMTKGWTWAERAMDMAEYLVCPDATGQPRIGLQLVFAPEPGKVFRHSLAIPSTPPTSPENFPQLSAPGSRFSTFSSCKTMSTWGRNRSATDTLRSGPRGSSILPHLLSSQHPRLLVSQGLGNGGTGLRSGHTLQQPPPHCRLRDASPLTLLLDSRRRYGHQRGMGDIVHVLIALQKFSVLQEIASLLPDDERTQMLDAIQKLSKETRRAVAARRAARTGQQQSQQSTVKSVKNKRFATAVSSQSLDTKLPQIYRLSPDPEGIPKESNDALEALALKQKETIARREAELDKMKENESLLGTCRAARAQHGGFSRPGLLLGGTGTLNGSMFLEPTPSLPLEFPSSRLSSYEGLHNSKVALLHLTEDCQLRLAPRLPLEKTFIGRKRDVVTKL